MEQENGKKEVVLVEFLNILSGKKWPQKYKDQQSNITLVPLKGLKLHEQTKNMLSTCDEWMKKKEKVKGNTWVKCF